MAKMYVSVVGAHINDDRDADFLCWLTDNVDEALLSGDNAFDYMYNKILEKANELMLKYPDKPILNFKKFCPQGGPYYVSLDMCSVVCRLVKKEINRGGDR